MKGVWAKLEMGGRSQGQGVVAEDATDEPVCDTDEKDEWVSFGSAASLSSNFPVTTDFNLSVSPFDLLYLRR